MWWRKVLMSFLLAASAEAAPVTLEIATQPGLQITAPQEWLQRLAAAEITQVRIRTAEPGDAPQVENIGDDAEPVLRAVGILTARNELLLPGRTFSLNQTAALRDYLDGLAADGESSIEAAAGRFGLTETQFRAVFDALSPKLDLQTKGQRCDKIVNTIADRLPLPLVIDAANARRLSATPALESELQTLTLGAALAITLHQANLQLVPEKPRGAEPQLRVVTSNPDADHWPLGYKPEVSPREAAPVLFEFFNIEIADHTLGQVLAALEPRLKLPLVWDTSAFTAKGKNPEAVKVKIARTKTYYKRAIDRVMAQARGSAELRVDESGAPFLWLTTSPRLAAPR
jgi:hypothetical protein